MNQADQRPTSTPQPPRTQSVAVVIAAYNASTTLARAIQSALAQPEATQVIVVDDASGDDTAQCARNCDDGSGRLIVLTQSHNQGPSAARNRALDHCTADWVAILDSDDFMLPGRIAGLLAASHDADLVADDLWQVDEADIHGPRRALLGNAHPLPREVNLEQFILSNIPDKKRPRGEMGFLKPIISTPFLRKHGLRYQEHMRLGEDYELYCQMLARRAVLRVIPPQGYIATIRANSLSGRHREEDLRQLRDSNLPLMKFPGLHHRELKALRSSYLSTDCRLQWRELIKAVKQKDRKAAAATFFQSPRVSLYLIAQLAGETFRRTLQQL